MSIVPLNLGSAPNDGNGQDLRSGGQVINANFAELDQRTTAAQSVADGAKAMADAAIPGTQKGQPNGVAALDGSGTVPASQLPSYVDDVLEFSSFAALPAQGETGKIYITIDNNKQYRWSGTQYVLLTASPGSTDSVPEGAVNKYWTLARTLGSVLTGLVTTSPAVIAATDTVLTAFGKLQKQIADLSLTMAGKAGKGSNSDITALTGLTTPLSVDQGGNGGVSTPYLPDANANQALNNRRFSTQDTWTGSPFAATDSRNFGYLDHWNWVNNDQQIQRWTSLDKTVPAMIRFKVAGVWDPSWTLAGGSSAWGAITGTLSAQTDLANALAAKLTGAASQLATAWINFNGQGTIAIRSGYNVSVTKVSTGVYRITFLTPMNNATYVVTQAFASDAPTSVDNFSATTLPRSMYIIESEKTVNSFIVRTGYNSASASAVLDFSSINLTVMGGK